MLVFLFRVLVWTPSRHRHVDAKTAHTQAYTHTQNLDSEHSPVVKFDVYFFSMAVIWCMSERTPWTIPRTVRYLHGVLTSGLELILLASSSVDALPALLLLSARVLCSTTRRGYARTREEPTHRQVFLSPLSFSSMFGPKHL